MGHIRVIESVSELPSLREAWEKLETSSRLPTQHYIWSHACAAAFGLPGTLRVMVYEDHGEIKAVVPLVRRLGTSRLEFLGAHELHEPTDMLGEPEYAFPLVRALLASGLPLSFRRLPTTSPLRNAFVSIFRGRGVYVSRSDHAWGWTSLEPGKDLDFFLSSKKRSDFRRRQRAAERMGSISYDFHAPTAATLGPLLQEAFAVENAGWKGRDGTAMAADPLRGPFNREYAAAATAKGIFRIAFLRINGQAAAMQLGMEWDHRYWLLRIGYDERFAAGSPGVLLFRESLHEAARQQNVGYEILGTVEPSMRSWVPLTNSCVYLRGYPLGLHSLSIFAREAAVYAGHRMWRTMWGSEENANAS